MRLKFNQFCQLPVTTSGKKKEENWSERFLLKVDIVVCYLSLIIFSIVELNSLRASRAVLTIRKASCTELGQPIDTDLGKPIFIKLGRPIEIELGKASDAELGKPFVTELGKPADTELGKQIDT